MAYYGFEHRYGSNMRNEEGDGIGTLWVFQSRAERDGWVANGNEFTSQAGARTAVRSTYAARWKRISAAVEHFSK